MLHLKQWCIWLVLFENIYPQIHPWRSQPSSKHLGPPRFMIFTWWYRIRKKTFPTESYEFCFQSLNIHSDHILTWAEQVLTHTHNNILCMTMHHDVDFSAARQAISRSCSSHGHRCRRCGRYTSCRGRHFRVSAVKTSSVASVEVEAKSCF